jgi:hypothetical protein
MKESEIHRAKALTFSAPPPSHPATPDHRDEVRESRVYRGLGEDRQTPTWKEANRGGVQEGLDEHLLGASDRASKPQT